MDINKHNETEFRCDEKEYLLAVTKFEHLENFDFWLRIKDSSGLNITKGRISLNGIKELKTDIEKIINQLGNHGVYSLPSSLQSSCASCSRLNP